MAVLSWQRLWRDPGMAHRRALVGLARALLIPIRNALTVFCTVWGESWGAVPSRELQSCLSVGSVVGGLVPCGHQKGGMVRAGRRAPVCGVWP